jgi:hypothetical protein
MLGIETAPLEASHPPFSSALSRGRERSAGTADLGFEPEIKAIWQLWRGAPKA